jgi:hypothetical protein
MASADNPFLPPRPDRPDADAPTRHAAAEEWNDRCDAIYRDGLSAAISLCRRRRETWERHTHQDDISRMVIDQCAKLEVEIGALGANDSAIKRAEAAEARYEELKSTHIKKVEAVRAEYLAQYLGVEAALAAAETKVAAQAREIERLKASVWAQSREIERLSEIWHPSEQAARNAETRVEAAEARVRELEGSIINSTEQEKIDADLS